MSYGDSDNDDVDDHATLLEVYEDPPISSKTSSGKWGSSVSTSVPLRDSAGIVRAAMGLDIVADDFLKEKNAVTKAFFWEGVPLRLLLSLSVVLINGHLAQLGKSRMELERLLMKVADHNQELQQLF